MIVRAASPGDRPAILALVARAFDGGEEEVALVERIWALPGHVPSLDLVAEEDGEFVGHILLSRGELDGRPALGLAPLAVAPARQRRGVGSALAREAIRLAEAAGEPLILVLGDVDYYARFGFEPAGPWGVTPALIRPRRPENFQIRRLSAFDGQGGAFRYAWEI